MEKELLNLQDQMKKEEKNLLTKIHKKDEEMNTRNEEYTALLQKMEVRCQC